VHNDHRTCASMPKMDFLLGSKWPAYAGARKRLRWIRSSGFEGRLTVRSPSGLPTCAAEQQKGHEMLACAVGLGSNDDVSEVEGA
jgi:hypothetical protein